MTKSSFADDTRANSVINDLNFRSSGLTAQQTETALFWTSPLLAYQPLVRQRRHQLHQVHKVRRKIDQPKIAQPKWYDSMSKMLPNEEPVQTPWVDRWIDIEPPQPPIATRWVDNVQVVPPPIIERKLEPIVTPRGMVMVIRVHADSREAPRTRLCDNAQLSPCLPLQHP